MVSRMLRKPIEIMKGKVSSLLDLFEMPRQWRELKYLIYSAHDT
jgi:hypothetical protein